MKMNLVALPDVHGLHYDSKTWPPLLKFLRDYKPDKIVLVGDFVNIDMLSRHTSGKPGTWDSLVEEYKLCNGLLDQLQKVADVEYIFGNHEDWGRQYTQIFPYLKGQVEPEICLKLKERGIKWYPYDGTPIQYGPIWMMHGEYFTDNHSKKTLLRYLRHTFYGHGHDIQSYSLEQFDETLVAQSIGCLCKYFQSYNKARPSAWQQGFGIFEIWDDAFTYEVKRITNHQFMHNKKLYD
jgi:predicted MPP superfamily phosphohydrolase